VELAKVVGIQILDNVETVSNNQLLQMAPNLQAHFNLTPDLPSIVQDKLASGSVIEPSSPSTKAIDATTINVDKQLPILPVTSGNGTLQNVLLDGGSKVNIITKDEWVRLSTPQSAPYRLCIQTRLWHS
jgi:hypothetical protein